MISGTHTELYAEVRHVIVCAMLASGPRNKSHSFVRGRAISSRKWRGERSLSIGILGFGEERVDWELGEEVIVCLFCS